MTAPDTGSVAAPARLRRGAVLRRLTDAARRVYSGYTGDDCQQSAAAIAYFVLFSIVPFGILVVSVFGFVLNNGGVRQNVIDYVVQNVHLSQTDGRRQVENALDTVRGAAAALTLIGLAGSAWGASSVFASTRKALNRVWGVREHRAFLKQKLVDLSQMGLLFLLLVLSIAVTALLRVLRQVSTREMPLFVNRTNPLWEIPGVLVPAALTLVAFTLVYRYVPAYGPAWRSALRGAAVATVLFEALKDTFAIYVAHFNNFHVVYGSLAALFLLLLYVYLAASVLLIGAEIAKTLGEPPPPPAEP